MQWLKYICLCLVLLTSTGCANWLYRMPIPQGNFLEQKDIDKLRVEMTREQVIYVLGQPIAKDAFDQNKWHYIYLFNYGRKNEQRKSIELVFNGDKLVSVNGDYEPSAEFSIPLEQ